MQRGVELERIRAPNLFDDDLFEPKIWIAKAAVFLVGPQHQHSLFAGSLERRPIYDAGLPPLFHVRRNFCFKKSPVGRAEHPLLVCKSAHS